MPDGFEPLEPLIRATAKASMARGNVTVTLKFVNKFSAGQLSIDPEGLSAALSALAEIDNASQSVGLNLAPMNAADVASLPGVLSAQSPDRIQIPPEVQNQVEEVFASLGAMRSQEGSAIGSILSSQLDRVEGIVVSASGTAEARAASRGDVLKEKVNAVLDASQEADPQRLSQELAILSVKADVTEEIDRLHAHISAARTLLDEGGAVGRKLDFLMQEFNREANTLCSKSGSTELTALGMELKVIVDQMREQVQNLE